MSSIVYDWSDTYDWRYQPKLSQKKYSKKGRNDE